MVPLIALKIGTIILDQDPPDIPKKSVLDSDNQHITSFRPGGYIAFNPVNSIPAVGLIGDLNFNSKWSIDFGIGLSRFSKQDDQQFDNFALNNRFGSNAIVTSMNEYKYYSIRLPIRINYHMNRHKIFAGLLLERPFLLSGSQEVSLTPELIDVALPGSDPLQSGINPDPVSALQNYNLNSAPELQKFFFHGQMGYSFELTRNVRLSTAASYRINRQQEVSPLIDNIDLSSSNVSRWGLLLRFDYLLGK